MAVHSISFDSKIGKICGSLTSATHVYLSAGSQYDLENQVGVAYRNKTYGCSVHVNLVNGEWISESPHVYCRDPYSPIPRDATPTAAKNIIQMVFEAWQDFIKANPIELDKAGVVDSEDKIYNVENLIDIKQQEITLLKAKLEEHKEALLTFKAKVGE